MKLCLSAVFAVLVACSVSVLMPAAHAAGKTEPAISEEASAALVHMGQSLQAQEFSFQAQTIRVYAGPKGEPLQIFHTLDVTVKRPNRLLVVRNGDDGQSKLLLGGALTEDCECRYHKLPPDASGREPQRESKTRTTAEDTVQQACEESQNES